MSNWQSRGSSRGGYTLVPNSEASAAGSHAHSSMNDAAPAANEPAKSQTYSPDESCCERWMDGKYTVIPEDSALLDIWDMAVLCALGATAVLLPFEVALVLRPPSQLYAVDNFINFIFGVDMIFTFNVAYATNDSGNNAAYERRPLRIAMNYMAVPFSNNMQSGWFWPDLLTIVPWESLPTRNMKSLRLVKVLRLLRMLRLVRVVKLLRRWQRETGVSLALVKSLRIVISTLLLVHWLACLWAHLGKNPNPEDHSKGMLTSWLVSAVGPDQDIADLSIFKIYMLSLYFCTVVLTTVGFGDITPTNNDEYIAMIVTIFVTGLAWAWVVASVVDILNNMDVYGSVFEQTMDDLNHLMRTRSVQSNLQFRIRKHLYESQHVHRMRHQLETTAWLSATLQGNLAMQSGVTEVIDCIWYLRRLQPQVLTEVALHFHPNLFSPHEFIRDQHSVSVIRKGSCMKNGKIKSRNHVIGEDMILATDYLKDSSCPRSITFLEVMTLTKNSLMMVSTKYPEFDQRLRKAQVKLALWRSFVRTAEKKRRQREKELEKQAHKRSMKRRSTWDAKFFVSNSSQSAEVPKVGWARHASESSNYDSGHTRLLESMTVLKYFVDAGAEKVRMGMEKLEQVGRMVEDHDVESKQRLEKLSRRLDEVENWAKDSQKMPELEDRLPARSLSRGWGKTQKP